MMSTHPYYDTQLGLIEELENNLTVLIVNGVLSLSMPNEFGVEDTLLQFPMVENLTKRGVLFKELELSKQSKVWDALSRSNLWRYTAQLQEVIHRNGIPAMDGITFYEKTATPVYLRCCAYSLTTAQLLSLLQRTPKVNERRVIAELMQEDPFKQGQTFTAGLTYGLLCHAFVPAMENPS